MSEQRYSIPVEGQGSVNAALSEVPDPRGVVMLAHGAGAGMDSPFMQYFHGRMADARAVAVRFEFGYMSRGRKAPDTAAKLLTCWRSAVASIRDDRRFAHLPLVIGGKSMGGRMASMALAEQPALANGLLLLGYPLHAAGKRDRLRHEHFPRLHAPALFLSGDRDTLCDLGALRGVLPTFGGRHELHVISGGDHSFKPLKRSGRTELECWREAGDTMVAWLETIFETRTS